VTELWHRGVDACPWSRQPCSGTEDTQSGSASGPPDVEVRSAGHFLTLDARMGPSELSPIMAIHKGDRARMAELLGSHVQKHTNTQPHLSQGDACAPPTN
jgi:hypothetical protein